jgi:hypothetical protein
MSFFPKVCSFTLDADNQLNTTWIFVQAINRFIRTHEAVVTGLNNKVYHVHFVSCLKIIFFSAVPEEKNYRFTYHIITVAKVIRKHYNMPRSYNISIFNFFFFLFIHYMVKIHLRVLLWRVECNITNVLVLNFLRSTIGLRKRRKNNYRKHPINQ